MTSTHEGGHIIGGWLGGATLVEADLLPWHLPHSLYQPDPIPLFTLWSGPIIGVVVPVGCALVLRRNWIWFVANFCLLANGSYIATAWISGDRFLDTPRLLDAGAWPSSILLYCAVTIGFGYFGFRGNCIELLTKGVSLISSRELEPMDRDRYLAHLSPIVADYRKRYYAFWLPYLSGNPIVFDIAGKKVKDCCIEINAFWDDKPNGDIRVTFSIDDGSSWRAFVPVTDSFIIAPDGSFVGEK